MTCLLTSDTQTIDEMAMTENIQELQKILNVINEERNMVLTSM